VCCSYFIYIYIYIYIYILSVLWKLKINFYLSICLSIKKYICFYMWEIIRACEKISGLIKIYFHRSHWPVKILSSCRDSEDNDTLVDGTANSLFGSRTRPISWRFLDNVFDSSQLSFNCTLKRNKIPSICSWLIYNISNRIFFKHTVAFLYGYCLK